MNKFILLAMLAVLASPVFAKGGGGGGGGHGSGGGHATASAHATVAESAHVSSTSAHESVSAAHESVSTAHESTSTSSGFSWSWLPYWPKGGHVSAAAPASGASATKAK